MPIYDEFEYYFTANKQYLLANKPEQYFIKEFFLWEKQI